MDQRKVVDREMVEKRAKHYGRAYQCLRCLHKDNKVRIDVKRRIEAHITKYHLRLDEVAHYCRLCFFRCWDRKTLDDHVRIYARHRRMVREQGLEGKDGQYLISNRDHYTIGVADYMVLSREKSLDFFKKKGDVAEEKEEEEEPLDLVAQAIQEVGGISTPVLGDELSAVLDTLPDLMEESLPLDLTKVSGEERILEQLLPSGDTTFTLDQEDEDMEPEPKRSKSVEPRGSEEIAETEEESSMASARQSLPSKEREERVGADGDHARTSSPARSTVSSSSSSTCNTITAERFEEMTSRLVGKLASKVEENTRAVRCLGKAMGEFSKAIEVIARSCKGMQEVMEERWRKEKAEEVQKQRERLSERRNEEEKRKEENRHEGRQVEEENRKRKRDEEKENNFGIAERRSQNRNAWRRENSRRF